MSSIAKPFPSDLKYIAIPTKRRIINTFIKDVLGLVG
jgi:hypothetical protein